MKMFLLFFIFVIFSAFAQAQNLEKKIPQTLRYEYSTLIVDSYYDSNRVVIPVNSTEQQKFLQGKQFFLDVTSLISKINILDSSQELKVSVKVIKYPYNYAPLHGLDKTFYSTYQVFALLNAYKSGNVIIELPIMNQGVFLHSVYYDSIVFLLQFSTINAQSDKVLLSFVLECVPIFYNSQE